MEYLTLVTYRWYLRVFVYKVSKNEQNRHTDYLSFLDLNAGPEYCFYYKCAITNLVVITSIVFGGGMPILYFIGLIAIAFQYFSDRLVLTYFYRMPPKYTERLTLGTIKLISFAPMVGLSLLCWQYTNMQMFDNKIDHLSTQDEVRLSHHFIRSLKWSKLTEAQQALFVCAALLILYELLKLAHGRCHHICEKKGAKHSHGAVKLPRADLPNFFDSIRKEDIDEFLEDYEHCREFGFSCFTTDSIQKLRQEQIEKSGGKMYTFKDVHEGDEDCHDHNHKHGHGHGHGIHDDGRKHSHASHLTSGFDVQLLMVGEPCYQPFRCLQYETQFNN